MSGSVTTLWMPSNEIGRPPRAVAPAGRHPAEVIGHLLREVADVLVGQEMAVPGGEEQLFAAGRERSGFGPVRIDEAPDQAQQAGLGGARRADRVEDRIRGERTQGREHVADDDGEVCLRLQVEERPQRLDLPAALGIRERSHAAGRRNRTGGLSTMLQPPAVTRIASQFGLQRSM